MPPLPPAPDVYQVTTFGTLAGQPCDHVINYYWNQSSTAPAEVCTLFAAADALEWMQQMGALLMPAYTHTSSRAVFLGDTLVPEAVASAGASGTATGTISTFGSCVTIRHPVPIRGRGKDGRTNIPGPQSQQVTQTDGNLVVGAQNAFLDAFNAYQTQVINHVQGLAPTGPALVVLDRKTGTFNVPGASLCDPMPNTHRRWQKRLSRHR